MTLLLKLAVRVRVSGSSITGLGTMGDDVQNGFNCHFDIKTGVIAGNRITLTGAVIGAVNPMNAGTPVQLDALVFGNFAQPLAFTFGTTAFNCAGLLADGSLKALGDGSIRF